MALRRKITRSRGAEIAAQLEAVQNGDFEPWELEGARSCMLSSLRSREDSAGRLEEYYLGQAATGLGRIPTR